MLYTYEYAGQVVQIRLERQPDGQYIAEIDGRKVAFHAAETGDAGWLLTMPDGRTRGYVARAGDTRHVHAAGQHVTLTVDSPARRRRRSGSGAGELTAEMPGQVIDVRVSEGDAVSAGDVLVVLEAMKMEIRVTAPADGTVKALLVSNGDVVERGQRLVDVTAPE